MFLKISEFIHFFKKYNGSFDSCANIVYSHVTYFIIVSKCPLHLLVKIGNNVFYSKIKIKMLMPQRL